MNLYVARLVEQKLIDVLEMILLKWIEAKQQNSFPCLPE